jgi:hypothetical protein
MTLVYNVYWFGSWQGVHGVSGRWSADPLGGIAGTLFSPARGPFVYSPWVALSLALLPFYCRRASKSVLVAMLIASLAPSALILGTYSIWWGGFSFGPRFWTDATPILAILFASALAWCREHGAAVRGVLYASQECCLRVYPGWECVSCVLATRDSGGEDGAHDRAWDRIDLRGSLRDPERAGLG